MMLDSSPLSTAIENSMNNSTESSNSASFKDSIKERIVNALQSEPEPPQTSIREKKKRSKKLVQATELHFKKVDKRESVGRVAVLFCNISDRPLYYKFKTDAMDSLSALPSATGHIVGRGRSKVVLTWQKPKHMSWKDVISPKLLLVTRFLDGSKEDKDVTGTRLIAVLDQEGSCPADAPPLETLMLDAASKDNGDGEMTVTKSSTKTDDVKDADGSTQESVQVANNNVVKKENPQDAANFNLVMAIAAIIFAMLLYRALVVHNVTIQ